MSKKAKILFYDLETSPRLVYVWGEYEQNVLSVVEESYILCFGYKWLGGKIKAVALKDFKNEKMLVKKLYEIMSEADIVIAHNGDRFDNKWANKQFIKHGLKPIEPYQSVDTLKVARKYFRFDSNKLDRLGEFLEVGRKEKHQGMDTWFGVMNGEPQAWKDMLRYVKQDVELLEQIYLKLRPWMDNHPNVNQLTPSEELQCPICESYNIHRRGYSIKGKLSKAIRYQCQDCGKYSQGMTQRIHELQIQ